MQREFVPDLVSSNRHGLVALSAACALAIAVSSLHALAGAQPKAREQSGAKGTEEKAVETIGGAGATFPYPLYAKWATAYAQETGVRVNYQAIGSGGGIKQASAGTVDFGASDAPLEPAELNKLGLVQWPTVIGGVVPIVNIPGVEAGQLKLTADLLAGIFLGDIKNWNDPKIAEINPGVKLPDASIQVVHRSDGSGTTWIITNYLQKVSATWKDKVGVGTAVSWPTGIGGKGNEGVASYVQRVSGAIGYVEFAYVLQNKMKHVSLRNRAGEFVQPSAASFAAAATSSDWAKAQSFYVVLTDQPGAKAWPITGATFVLMKAKQSNAAKAKAVLSFFDWGYDKGDDMAHELNYVPMPDSVVQLVRRAWQQQIHGPGDTQVWGTPK